MILAERLTQVADGTLSLRRRQQATKFFEIADDFLEYSRGHKRSSAKDEVSVRRLKAFFKDVLCGSITKSQIEKYILQRKKGGELGPKAKPSTINRELACLRSIFRRALNNGKISVNPMSGFRLLEEDNVRNRVLTDEEFERLLEKAPRHIIPVLITARETGMEKGWHFFGTFGI